MKRALCQEAIPTAVCPSLYDRSPLVKIFNGPRHLFKGGAPTATLKYSKGFPAESNQKGKVEENETLNFILL